MSVRLYWFQKIKNKIIQKYTINISGLTYVDSASIRELECENCKVSSSDGFTGISKDILNIVGDDPIIQSIVANVIASILKSVKNHGIVIGNFVLTKNGKVKST